MSLLQIAIDGPAGAGKGTVTRLLSARLGIPCLDTGAIYRGLTIHLMNCGNFDNVNISADIKESVTRITLDGVDITDRIHTNEVTQYMISSQIATMPNVRKIATHVAQDLLKRHSCIVEGRDICSVVLPDAKFKFYLTATAEERAKRRMEELKLKGVKIPYKQVLDETNARDTLDYTKGGLKLTPDAHVIDSTNMTIDDVVEYMLRYIANAETK